MRSFGVAYSLRVRCCNMSCVASIRQGRKSRRETHEEVGSQKGNVDAVLRFASLLHHLCRGCLRQWWQTSLRPLRWRYWSCPYLPLGLVREGLFLCKLSVGGTQVDDFGIRRKNGELIYSLAGHENAKAWPSVHQTWPQPYFLNSNRPLLQHECSLLQQSDNHRRYFLWRSFTTTR